MPKPTRKQSRSRPASIALVGFLIWAVLTAIVFVGMRNYPELPGQKVPKPWMLSVFLLFLVVAGVWAHIYFGYIHHRIRIVAAHMLKIKSRAGSIEDGNILVDSSPDDWEAASGTAVHKVLFFSVFEWAAIVVGIIVPIALLLTSGAILTAYLSEQISGNEIASWFGW